MTENVAIQMSQGFEILPPRAGQAYPIPCDEWASLKERLSRSAFEPWFYHTIGSVFIGVAASTFISILLGVYESPAQHSYLPTAWAVVATSSIVGFLCLIFAHQQRLAARERAGDVIAQMDLIEKRYERTPA